MMRPTILLGMMNDAGIAKIVAENLRFHGFDVVDFSLDSLTFKYPNLRLRLQTQIKKICGNKQAKKQLMVALKRQELQSILAKHTHFDYALFIRADVYPEDFLQEIKSKSGLMVNYQWDGIDRFAAIKNQIMAFDQFYVFDPDDLGRYPEQLQPATSFYFDHLPPRAPSDDRIYYLGAHREDRQAAILAFCYYAEEHHLKLNFQIACPNPSTIKQSYPVKDVLFHHGISYQDNLMHAQNASVLADFVISSHKGLSLRTFEAIAYRKKLITTNQEVAKYDFYHPDNIFIWDGKNLDGLAQFLNRPYCELETQIYEKYSFGNWIRYILKIEPHQALMLPEK